MARGRPKKLENFFKPVQSKQPKGNSTGQGMPGFDNARENIDPHVKTSAVSTKQGTIQDAPANNKDLVNKEYVDGKFPVTHASTTGQTTDDHHNKAHNATHEVAGDDLVNHDDLTGFVSNEHIDWTNATQDFKTTGTGTFGDLSVTDLGLTITSSGIIQDAAGVGGGMNIELSAFGQIVGSMYMDGVNTFNCIYGMYDFQAGGTSILLVESDGWYGGTRIIFGKAEDATPRFLFRGEAGNGIFQWNSYSDYFEFLNDVVFYGDLQIKTDNKRIVFGSGGNSSILWDGSDMIIQSLNITANDELLFKSFDNYVFDNHIKQVDNLIHKFGTTDTDLQISSDGTNGIIDVATSLRIGNITTNYSEFSPTGDLVFVGSAGLPFAEIYAYDANTTITITCTGIANKVQITTFDTNGLSNNATPDHTNDHITITKAGVYKVNVSIHAESTGGTGYEAGFALYKNNGATLFPNVHGHRELSGGGGDTGSISLTGLVDLAVNDTIELWVWNETNTNNIIIDDVTLNLIQIGG